MKTDLIQDCLDTISRLNKELEERISFEHKLIEIIQQLQDKTNEVSEEIKEIQKANEVIEDCYNRTGILIK